MVFRVRHSLAALVIALLAGFLVVASPLSAAAAVRVAAVVQGVTQQATPAETRGAADQQVLTVVGLGDSVEAAYACDCDSFLESVAAQLGARQGTVAEVVNEAVPGLATDDVLAQLALPAVQAQVRAADVVVIEIGANDFDEADAYLDSCVDGSCFAAQAALTEQNLAEIVARVTALRSGSGAGIVVLGYWNVFEDGLVAEDEGATYVAASEHLTTVFNGLVAGVAQRAGAVYADAYAAFRGDGAIDDTDLLVDDGEHPNAAGQAALAQAVVEALDAPAAAAPELAPIAADQA